MLDCLIVAYVTQRDRYEWWNLAQVPLGCLHLEPGYPRGRVVANAGTHDTLGGCGRTSLTGRTLRHLEVGRSLAVHRLPAARGWRRVIPWDVGGTPCRRVEHHVTEPDYGTRVGP